MPLTPTTRIESLNVLLTEGGNAFLNELYGYTYESIRDQLTSDRFKNKELSGDIRAGSVTVTRPAISIVRPYGTARAAQKGDSIRLHDEVVQITTRREVLEEIEENDVHMIAVSELLTRRADMHARAIAEELETVFYDTTAAAGTVYTPPASVTTLGQAIDGIVLELMAVRNDFVRGVPRSLVHVIVPPQVYSALRDYIDTKSNPNVNTSPYSFGMYHGVPVYETAYLPPTTGAIALVAGTVAQPVHMTQYAAERIQLSNATTGVSMFCTYGTKAIAPDLIFTMNLTDMPGMSPSNP